MGHNRAITLDQANEIVDGYGKFVEVANGPLLELFHAQIPESLLPYPKAVIEEALETMQQYWLAEGNHDAVEMLGSVKALLLAYADSTQAINGFGKRVSDEAWRKAVLPRLGSSQARHLEGILA